MRVSANYVYANSHNRSIMSRPNYQKKVKPEDTTKFYCDAEEDPDVLEKYTLTKNLVSISKIKLFIRTWWEDFSKF